MKCLSRTPLRISPVHTELQHYSGQWQDINQMPCLLTTPDDQTTQLGVADLTCLHRFGVKGAAAATWLASQNIPVPARPNSWCPLAEDTSGHGLVARLGLNELLIEDSLQTPITAQLRETNDLPEQVCPVLRQDLAIALSGQAVHDLLLQTCNVNFKALCLSDHPVVLTSMIGVSVTVIPGTKRDRPFYRIWCDGTFGLYVWRTLVTIMNQLGGGVVGAGQWL